MAEESFEQSAADRLRWNAQVREHAARELGELSAVLDVPHQQCEALLPPREAQEALDLEIEAMRRGVPRVTHRHLRPDGSFMELAWGDLERCIWR